MEDHRVTGWLMPVLLSTAVALLGWVGLNINRMSENLAVVTFRLEAQANTLKDVDNRIKVLEKYAVLRKRNFPMEP